MFKWRIQSEECKIRHLPPNIIQERKEISHNRKNIGPEAILHSALSIMHLITSGPCHFNKEQTPPEIYSIPARGFTAAVSVFRGTPPPKPLNCKSVSNHPGALISNLWADPTGEEPSLFGAILSFVLPDIIETSFYYPSQSVHLSLLPSAFSFRGCFRETKNPAYTR